MEKKSPIYGMEVSVMSSFPIPQIDLRLKTMNYMKSQFYLWMYPLCKWKAISESLYLSLTIIVYLITDITYIKHFNNFLSVCESVTRYITSVYAKQMLEAYYRIIWLSLILCNVRLKLLRMQGWFICIQDLFTNTKYSFIWNECFIFYR